MKNSILAVLSVLLGMVLASSLMAQDHVLISEFVVTPTAGEFIEIYNPTSETIDLTNYYITDATFAGGPTYYYQIVTGGGGGGSFGDFNARFPDGASIAPGEHQTLSLSGSTNFVATYGVDPTYELFEDDAAPDAIPDMLEAVPGSINGQGGLTNGGEVIIVYYWDGESDLVQDVDYVVWGDKAEAVDKTGVSIDGPDADSDPSTYADDTPIDDQYVVNADNDDDEEPHDAGMSAQRVLDVEDVEDWGPGGNGITGHNETSENTSWMGGIWSFNATPTPGTRSFGKPAADSLTIADIQYVRAAEIGENAMEDSPFADSTIEVSGIVLHSMRQLFLGGRYGGFIMDEHGGPWSGFFIIQDDSMVGGTNLSAAQPGDRIRVKGLLQEFPTDPNTQSITQINLQLAPVAPVEFLGFGIPLPDTILLKPGDLGATGSSEDPRLTERWESTLVRFENLTVQSNFPGQPGNIMIAGDETGTIALDDYSLELRQYLDSHQGVWPGFPAGTVINVTGFVRDVVTGGAGRTTINPLSFDAIEIASAPPEIAAAIQRDPPTPSSSDNVNISVVIQSALSTVAAATMNYRVDGGAFQEVSMTNEDSLYTGTIPAQPNNSFIEYYITAEDAGGLVTSAPGDTSDFKYFYFVRDEGTHIHDLQFTPFENGNSGYAGLQVTITGTVTSPKENFDGTFINRAYYIQDDEATWSGIQVFDPADSVGLGDNITITGTVQENFNVTRLTDITAFTRNSSGNPVPSPVVVTTGEIATGGANAEAYESVLVEVQNLTVADPFPDGDRNFGEFSVDDGSGPVRVDDESQHAYSQLDTMWAGGEKIDFIRGIHDYFVGEFKIEPRNNGDLGNVVAVEDDSKNVPFSFALRQNYPNPFNPETTIRYQLPQRANVKITIFNILGQKVKTLVDELKPAGAYQVVWNGTNDRGSSVSTGIYIYRMEAADFIKNQKMLFLK